MVWVAFGMALIALALASQVLEKNKKLERRIKDLEEKL
jgi:heme exporter protein D